jgi:hypothetical protein
MQNLTILEMIDLTISNVIKGITHDSSSVGYKNVAISANHQIIEQMIGLGFRWNILVDKLAGGTEMGERRIRRRGRKAVPIRKMTDEIRQMTDGKTTSKA